MRANPIFQMVEKMRKRPCRRRRPAESIKKSPGKMKSIKKKKKNTPDGDEELQEMGAPSFSMFFCLIVGLLEILTAHSRHVEYLFFLTWICSYLFKFNRTFLLPL